MSTLDRSHLNFTEEAPRAFAFLREMGFSEVEAQPTLLRYRKDGVEVDLYHGRRSYEVGAGVALHGTRYGISAIIHCSDPELAERFRIKTATTLEGVQASLEELGTLMRRYGAAALEGNTEFFVRLEHEQKLWVAEYALDVLAGQLRPQAHEAFRQRDYARAAELFSRIQRRLSPSELRKLSIAEDRRAAPSDQRAPAVKSTGRQ